MPRPLRILCALSLLLVATFALAPPASAQTSRPNWTPGDFWSYRVSGIETTKASGSVRFDVAGNETVRVGGTAYLSWRLNTTENVSWTSGGTTTFANVSGHTWYRESDLAIVMQNLSGTEEMQGSGSASVTANLTWNPPQPLGWPLFAAGTWSATTRRNETLTLGGFPVRTSISLTTTFLVLADVGVTVPAGTYTTSPLKATNSDGYVDEAWWSDFVGNGVRRQGSDAFGNRVRYDLTAYRYQYIERDLLPPSITDVATSPATPFVGQSIGVSAAVTDDVALRSVYINVTYPDGSHTNGTMNAAGGRYSYSRQTTQSGTHTFVIWASDIGRKWASQPGSFVVRADTEPPVIQPTPPPSLVYTETPILIEANVTDNQRVVGVFLNFTDVTGAPLNVTMEQLGDVYNFTIRGQGQAGTVVYTIWAVDPANHWSKVQGTVRVEYPPLPAVVTYVTVIAIGLLVAFGVSLVVAWRMRRPRPAKTPPPVPPPATPPPPP